MAKGTTEAAETAVGTAARRGRPRSIKTTNGLAATTIDAVARRSDVSKMTIYKWWPSREALLIDAFLHHAAQMLPLPASGSPAARAKRHAVAYAEALQGEFGKVQLAVISECRRPMSARPGMQVQTQLVAMSTNAPVAAMAASARKP